MNLETVQGLQREQQRIFKAKRSLCESIDAYRPTVSSEVESRTKHDRFRSLGARFLVLAHQEQPDFDPNYFRREETAKQTYVHIECGGNLLLVLGAIYQRVYDHAGTRLGQLVSIGAYWKDNVGGEARVLADIAGEQVTAGELYRDSGDEADRISRQFGMLEESFTVAEDVVGVVS